jgi:hypothetical protein
MRGITTGAVDLERERVAGSGRLTQELHQGVIHGRARGLQDEHVGVADILAQLDVALPVVEPPRVCLEDAEGSGSWEEGFVCVQRRARRGAAASEEVLL